MLSAPGEQDCLEGAHLPRTVGVARCVELREVSPAAIRTVGEPGFALPVCYPNSLARPSDELDAGHGGSDTPPPGPDPTANTRGPRQVPNRRARGPAGPPRGRHRGRQPPAARPPRPQFVPVEVTGVEDDRSASAARDGVGDQPPPRCAFLPHVHPPLPGRHQPAHRPPQRGHIRGQQPVGRPPSRPRARAAACPAWVRSRIRSRSLCQRAEDVEHQPAAGGGGVDGLLRRAEPDPAVTPRWTPR